MGGRTVLYVLAGLLIVEAYVISRIAAQLGGLRNILLAPRRIWRPGHGIAEIGRPIRTIRGFEWNEQRWRRARFRVMEEAIVVIADVRSVAARRVARVLTSLCSVAPSPLSWNWYVAGRPSRVQGLLKEASLDGTFLAINMKSAYRAGATGMPLAIYTDRAGVVRNMGFVPDSSALAAFVNGCPNSQFRRWAMTANQQLTVDDHSSADTPLPPELNIVGSSADVRD